MRSIGRVAALLAVLGMPGIAYVLARVCVSMWQGMDSTSLADTGLALEDGLTLLAAAVGATIAGYLALTGYAMLLGAAWRGGRAIPKALAALAPQGWTKVTATALGLSMSAGLSVPALAAEGSSSHAPSAGWVAAPISVVVNPAPAPLAVGWVEADPAGTSPQSSGARAQLRDQVQSTLHDVSPPTIATSGAAPSQSAPLSTSAPTSSTYVVQPGDSLWRITEALLGADANVAKIAATWPQLYESNRGAIGDNPSLIHPGLALTVPAGLGS